MKQIKDFFKNYNNIYRLIPVVIPLISMPSFLFYAHINPKAHLFEFLLAGTTPSIVIIGLFFALHTFLNASKRECSPIQKED